MAPQLRQAIARPVVFIFRQTHVLEQIRHLAHGPEVRESDTRRQELRRDLVDETDGRRDNKRGRFFCFFVEPFHVSIKNLLVDRLEVCGGWHGAREGRELDLAALADLEAAGRGVHGRDDLHIHNFFSES